MSPHPELSLNNGWSITEEAFDVIVQLLEEWKPRRMIEFGAGASSIRLAQSFPETQIISVESRCETWTAAQRLQQKWLKEHSLTLLFRAQALRWFGFKCYRTYQKFEVPQDLDAAIIDGPRTRYNSRGREACLYMIYDRLRIGSTVIVDDYCRKEEKVIVQNWLETYPGSFEVRRVAIGHELILLTKTRQVRPRWFSIRRLWDNARSHWYDYQKAQKDKKKLGGSEPSPSGYGNT